MSPKFGDIYDTAHSKVMIISRGPWHKYPPDSFLVLYLSPNDGSIGKIDMRMKWHWWKLIGNVRDMA